MIPFRVKKLTETAKAPHRNRESDLWDLYAHGFEYVVLGNIFKHEYPKDLLDIDMKWHKFTEDHDMKISESKKAFLANCTSFELLPSARILVKTGLKLELPALYYDDYIDCDGQPNTSWAFENELKNHSGIILNKGVYGYAVADIHPCSNTLEQKGLFIENKIITGGEVCFVAINHGHEPITITKGDKICQMSLRPLYPSKMEIVEDIKGTGKGGLVQLATDLEIIKGTKDTKNSTYGSTGK